MNKEQVLLNRVNDISVLNERFSSFEEVTLRLNAKSLSLQKTATFLAVLGFIVSLLRN
jgi:deoxyhypusine synthase